MFMRTRRLFLRPIWPEDQQSLTAIAEASDIAEMGDLLGDTRDQPAETSQRRMLVTCPEGHGNAPVGVVVADPGAAPRVWIEPSFRGQGFADEAARGAGEMLASVRG